jgi:hypothetical protein
VKKTLFMAALIAAFASIAIAQDSKPLPPKSLSEVVAIPAAPGSPAVMRKDWQPNTPPTKLFFCPPKTCLWYAGDPDTTNKNENGLFDFYNPGIGIIDAQVWVGVKPTKNATVTGTSGNYFNTATGVGTNPTPFLVQTGITTGHAGKTVCKTNGNIAFQSYCEGDFGLNCDNFYIKKLANSCKMKAGKVYFIDLTPQYNDGSTIGYLADVPDRHPKNHKGWPNVYDDSFAGPGYYPTWGSSGVCSGIGCIEFSMSLTGHE